MSASDDEVTGQLVTRRQALALLAVGGGAALAGRAPAAAAVLPESLSCIARPAQTEGPYFVDARLDRSDIRHDPVDGSVSAGVPLAVTLRVHRIAGGACVPLAGAVVDLWQCDVEGRYSDVLDTRGRFDTRGRQFLRGFQTTDGDGVARFRTVYPGWYEGRTPHLHFKIRLIRGASTTHEFTSQLYFDEAITDAVYRRPPYDARGPRSTMNAQDGIFRGGGTGAQLLLPVAADGDGYAGSFEIGLMV